jgi:hypothetical protein
LKEADPLEEILRSSDPLAGIDLSDDTGGALSSVGLVHLFRQFFFDLGTFLGEPVEHVWLAPGTTIELVEVSTRRTLVEQQIETLVESVSKSEHSETLKDEISDAVKEENQNSTKLGVTQTNTVNAYVYQGTVSANFGIESTRTQAREAAHKQNREQNEKLSSEIKRSIKTLFRTVTETTDTRSRRHVLKNEGTKLINYELRRKMRRIGVQVQDIGMRLCWQVFVDDPGAELGVARLVHLADREDLSQIHAPEVIPYPPPVKLPHRLLLPFQRHHGDNDTGNMYIEDGHLSDSGHIHLGDENDKIKVNYPGHRVAPPPGYRLANVSLKNVAGDHYLDPVFFNVTDGGFDVHLRQAFFPVEGRISAEVELEFLPTKAELDRIDKDNEKKTRETTLEQRRKIKEGYIKAIRERIRLASKIERRPGWDLREEERTVVYRQLLRRLMLDSWQKPGTPEQRRINHVRSELIRSIFDIDSMLYFVAPEWWVPRLHRSRQMFNPAPATDPAGNTIPMAEIDPVGWGGTNEAGRDNYDITDDSAPARLGSSLGWLLQLDGDNLRNAFFERAMGEGRRAGAPRPGEGGAWVAQEHRGAREGRLGQDVSRQRRPGLCWQEDRRGTGDHRRPFGERKRQHWAGLASRQGVSGWLRASGQELRCRCRSKCHLQPIHFHSPDRSDCRCRVRTSGSLYSRRIGSPIERPNWPIFAGGEDGEF